MSEANSSKLLCVFLSTMRLSVVASDKADLTEPVLQLAKCRSVDIFVGRIGAQENTECRQDAIDRGAIRKIS